MGRLIDVSDLHNAVMLNKSDWGIFATPIDQIVEGLVSQVSTVEAIPKADYEARLKADIVAILTDIQLDIEECVDGGEGSPQFEQGVDIARRQVVDIIQQKINALKSDRSEE